MSVTPFITLDNQLTSTWGPPTSYPDGELTYSMTPGDDASFFWVENQCSHLSHSSCWRSQEGPMSPQVQWWCAGIPAPCGLGGNPSLISGRRSRCGNGCSKFWTCTRLTPPTFPSKTLMWTAISCATWVTRTLSLLPAVWGPSSSRESLSSSGAVSFHLWVGPSALGGKYRSLFSAKKKKKATLKGLTLLLLECCWEWLELWRSRGLLKAREMMDLVFAFARLVLLTKPRGEAKLWIQLQTS